MNFTKNLVIIFLLLAVAIGVSGYDYYGYAPTYWTPSGAITIDCDDRTSQEITKCQERLLKLNSKAIVDINSYCGGVHEAAGTICSQTGVYQSKDNLWEAGPYLTNVNIRDMVCGNLLMLAIAECNTLADFKKKTECWKAANEGRISCDAGQSTELDQFSQEGQIEAILATPTETTYTCTDSDGGNVPNIKGTATETITSPTGQIKLVSVKDKCDANTLIEAICVGDRVKTKDITCPTAAESGTPAGTECVDGKCVEIATYECTDPDGVDLTRKTTVQERAFKTNVLKTKSDTCANLNTVSEAVCAENRVTTKDLCCQTGTECVYGKCESVIVRTCGAIAAQENDCVKTLSAKYADGVAKDDVPSYCEKLYKDAKANCDNTGVFHLKDNVFEAGPFLKVFAPFTLASRFLKSQHCFNLELEAKKDCQKKLVFADQAGCIEKAEFAKINFCDKGLSTEPYKFENLADRAKPATGECKAAIVEPTPTATPVTATDCNVILSQNFDECQASLLKLNPGAPTEINSFCGRATFSNEALVACEADDIYHSPANLWEAGPYLPTINDRNVICTLFGNLVTLKCNTLSLSDSQKANECFNALQQGQMACRSGQSIPPYLFEATPTAAPTVTTYTYTCTDSDGTDPKTKGTVTETSTSSLGIVEILTDTDTCADTNTVIETICVNNLATTTDITCPTGTECVKEEGFCKQKIITYTCTDSDRGNFPNTKGTATETSSTGLKKAVADKCDASTTTVIHEAICEEKIAGQNRAKLVPSNCATGTECSDGACKAITVTPTAEPTATPVTTTDCNSNTQQEAFRACDDFLKKGIPALYTSKEVLDRCVRATLDFGPTQACRAGDYNLWEIGPHLEELVPKFLPPTDRNTICYDLREIRRAECTSITDPQKQTECNSALNAGVQACLDGKSITPYSFEPTPALVSEPIEAVTSAAVNDIRFGFSHEPTDGTAVVEEYNGFVVHWTNTGTEAIDTNDFEFVSLVNGQPSPFTSLRRQALKGQPLEFSNFPLVNPGQAIQAELLSFIGTNRQLPFEFTVQILKNGQLVTEKTVTFTGRFRAEGEKCYGVAGSVSGPVFILPQSCIKGTTCDINQELSEQMQHVQGVCTAPTRVVTTYTCTDTDSTTLTPEGRVTLTDTSLKTKGTATETECTNGKCKEKAITDICASTTTLNEAICNTNQQAKLIPSNCAAGTECRDGRCLDVVQQCVDQGRSVVESACADLSTLSGIQKCIKAASAVSLQCA